MKLGYKPTDPLGWFRILQAHSKQDLAQRPLPRGGGTLGFELKPRSTSSQDGPEAGFLIGRAVPLPPAPRALIGQ